MDEILDYHPEDFDVCVRPGVTREGERQHFSCSTHGFTNKEIPLPIFVNQSILVSFGFMKINKYQ